MPSSTFSPDRNSLARYECPEWFRDAKFGIWSHWGPQAVPGQGDWYARRLYQGGELPHHYGSPPFKQGGAPDPVHLGHLARYGHPSVFGYKDIIPLWKAEKWDPDELMNLYVRAGARYFVSMAVHHDNFDLWDSTHQPRWNATRLGPMRDVVGEWRRAAKKHGLPFGVSEHLAASFNWYQVNKGADVAGPFAGVPYDGNNPANWDLYHPPADPDDHEWLTTNPAFHATWLSRIRDLVDRYHPELLYSDSKLPFGSVGETLVAHYYNSNLAHNGGRLTAVYNCKEEPVSGGWVRDIERGVMETAASQPWQTDTSIGDWYYREGETYKSAAQIIHMLADIVSKNGNLLLNVVQYADGRVPDDARRILEEIAAWMRVNGEAIFSTRPWSVYGEGPSTEEAPEPGHFGGAADVRSKPYVPGDIRYTRSKDGEALHAIALAWPADGTLALRAMRGVRSSAGAEVRLLGHAAPLRHTLRGDGALVVELPERPPCAHAWVLRLTGFATG
ncbi:MAG: alpha-L-fucosidase [Opitutaceae bacterium]|nr:alpha-L-fucosidase [Opitutaceae bacterium]